MNRRQVLALAALLVWTAVLAAGVFAPVADPIPPSITSPTDTSGLQDEIRAERLPDPVNRFGTR